MVSITAVLLVTPCYLQVLPPPKSVFVLLPAPMVVIIKGFAALSARWAANVSFGIAVFGLTFGIGRALLRPNYSFKRTAAG